MLAPRAVVVSLLALSLAGCLNTSTIIRVTPTGSGTIAQTLLISTKGIENAFAGMGFKSSGSKSTTRTMKPIDEAEMRQSVVRLGEGVSLLSVVPVKLENGFEGVTARFAFEDISKLRTEDFLMPGPASEMASSGSRDRIGFALARGADGASILTPLTRRPARRRGRRARRRAARATTT